MIDALKSVGVVELGVMGFDIAFLYAQKGYRTLVYDAAPAAMDGLASRREQVIERLKRQSRISERDGLKFTRGPLAEIDEIGAAAVPQDLEELNPTLPGGKPESSAILSAMAAARETFSKSAQPNPAITKYVGGNFDARH
jgi:UDP-N-acetyl-D-mannosaminuronate dehydrogenase